MRKLTVTTIVLALVAVLVEQRLPLAWQPPIAGLEMFVLLLVVLDPRGSDDAVPAQRMSLTSRLLKAYGGGLCVALAYGWWVFHR